MGVRYARARIIYNVHARERKTNMPRHRKEYETAPKTMLFLGEK
jgi:hypothetical protein